MARITGLLMTGLVFLTAFGCAQKTQILEREDGTYTSVANGPTEREALKLAAAKATEMCKAQKSRFALVDRRTTHHGGNAKGRKLAANAPPEDFRVELVFACK